MRHLFKPLGVESFDDIVLNAVADFNWIAADFTIFDVGLAPHRSVQDHRNLFPTIWTGEVVFHQEGKLQENHAAEQLDQDTGENIQVTMTVDDD
jgi:hypothetical protein